jgi:non-heme chloroperoxidase
MGSSVIWSYWQLCGKERLSKLIFVDQMPMITANPKWSPQAKEDSSAIFNPTSLYETINKLGEPEGVKTTEGFIGGMFPKAYSRPEVEWVVKQNSKMPGVRRCAPVQPRDPGLASGHPADHAAHPGCRR